MGAKSEKQQKIDHIREAAEADLVTFIKLIAPKTVLGAVHVEVCDWWTRQERKTHQLVLLPRDHQKSRLVRYRNFNCISHSILNVIMWRML